jgi:hypothetical protein
MRTIDLLPAANAAPLAERGSWRALLRQLFGAPLAS